MENEMSGYVVDAMANAIEESEIFVCCISKNYENPINPMDELRYAKSIKKKIVPIRLEKQKMSNAIEFVIASILWFEIENVSEEQIVIAAKHIAKQTKPMSKPIRMKQG
ncbi:hypothetical protein HK098_001638 [Nowakowskiella sp. JEL0407]|nr:hypothetical protein HK098_001638 [Nowakowskiella sp. JEL0407]